MIHSMTGFGRKEKLINKKNIVIEISSLNSKSLDLNLKIDDSISFLHEYLRRSIKEKIKRGKVNVSLNIDDSEEDQFTSFKKTKIKSFLKELKKDFQIDESLIISNLLINKGYLNSKVIFSKSEEKEIKILIDTAIDEQILFRKIEGKAIGIDLKKSVSKIDTYIKKIISIESSRIKDKKEKFKSYFKELEDKFDKSRLEQEIIYYLEKLDINEEIIRLQQHLRFFSSEINIKDVRGKKLSFIAQEIGREINTIGSKANNFKIQNMVINMKEELEKIKENLLNII